MKITDIIRGILDVIDRVEQPEHPPAAAIEIAVDTENDLADMQKLAGLPCVDDSEFANTPDELVLPLTSAFPAGDDVHHSKNPADIRADSVSMFPDWQARK